MAYQPETDNDGVIKSGLYATPMRNLTENKGLLDKKGMLYAGTGKSKEFVCGVKDNKDIKISVPVTTAINPLDAAEGSVLIKKSTEDGGWIVDKIDANSLKDSAVTAAKLGSDIVNTTSKSANGITVTLQQNATTKKLDIGLTSDKVINATNATYAQYATNADNATNATNAQKLAFFEQGWTELNGGILDQRDTNTNIVGTWSLPRENGMDAVFLRLDIEDPHGVITTMGFWVPIMPSAASELPTTAVSPVLSLSGKNDTSILCQCWINSLVNSALVTLRVIDSNIASFYFGQDKYSYKMYYEAYME